MKEAFRVDLRLSPKNRERLTEINLIIEEYRAAGYTMTLRQLYYQLVSRAVIPNLDAEYKKLGTLLVKGRMAGVVDWSAIEDRVRVPKHTYWVTGIRGALLDTARQYRLNRQKDQLLYIEVWCEKDALSNVLSRVTEYYHIRLMVNRGYSSCTAVHDAYDRLKFEGDSVILYIGDHDPSGLDMIRDVQNRLAEFGVQPRIDHIALTASQIDEYQPPPNPAKITDPRARDYIDQHGDESWEVDALPPDVLDQLLRDSIEAEIDLDLFQEQLEQEEGDKGIIQKFAEEYDLR